MNRTIILAIFAALVIAQCAVPTAMIVRREIALARGLEYKIRVVPVDPYDAFRGRFVRLGVGAANIPIPQNIQLADGQRAYALLERDTDGFIRVNAVAFTTPGSNDYLKIRLRHTGNGQAAIIWPFDRYYMEESAAPLAEQRYRERARDDAAYITVRIWDGTGVITGLFLEGKPIEQAAQTP